LLALFYNSYYNKPICNVALLVHCNRTFWAMAWWTSVMAFVSEWVLSVFTLFVVFYVGLMVITAISCIEWFQRGPSAPFDGNNVSFFGVKRYLKQIETENEEEVGATAPTTLSVTGREPLLLWPSMSPNRGTPRTQRTIEILIPQKTDQRCMEVSTMHIIVDHIQKCSRQGDATYKVTLSNVGLEAGSLKPLATFLVGYLQLKGGCCTNSKSEVAVLCNDAQECCINPHSFLCFCCFPKPKDIQRGLFNCLQCVTKHTPECPIKSLSLTCNELGRKTKALQLIRDMLKGNSSLMHFDISNNELGAKGSQLVADGLCW
jgi:hypothetical protein